MKICLVSHNVLEVDQLPLARSLLEIFVLAHGVLSKQSIFFLLKRIVVSIVCEAWVSAVSIAISYSMLQVMSFGPVRLISNILRRGPWVVRNNRGVQFVPGHFATFTQVRADRLATVCTASIKYSKRAVARLRTSRIRGLLGLVLVHSWLALRVHGFELELVPPRERSKGRHSQPVNPARSQRLLH